MGWCDSYEAKPLVTTATANTAQPTAARTVRKVLISSLPDEHALMQPADGRELALPQPPVELALRDGFLNVLEPLEQDALGESVAFAPCALAVALDVDGLLARWARNAALVRRAIQELAAFDGLAGA